MRAVYFTYSRINSTKRPASGAVKFIEPRLTSEVGLVRECICAYISVFLQLEWSGCRYSPAYVAAEIMWLGNIMFLRLTLDGVLKMTGRLWM